MGKEREKGRMCCKREKAKDYSQKKTSKFSLNQNGAKLIN